MESQKEGTGTTRRRREQKEKEEEREEGIDKGFVPSHVSRTTLRTRCVGN